MKTRSNQIDFQCTMDGVVYTICKPGRARKHERTWTPFSKYSVFNQGHQAMISGRRGVRGGVDCLTNLVN